MLLRAVQFGPDGYFRMRSEEKGRDLIRDGDPIMDFSLLRGYLNRFRKPIGDKPMANLVISLPIGGSRSNGTLHANS